MNQHNLAPLFYESRPYAIETWEENRNHLIAQWKDIIGRPFLLIGGEFDHPGSWQYINEAKKVYRLYRAEGQVEFLDHAAGHQPPEPAVEFSYKWLAKQFDLPYREWKI